MYYIERQWKEIINGYIRQGINDPKFWAERGGNDVLNLKLNSFGIDIARNELRLVLLFR